MADLCKYSTTNFYTMSIMNASFNLTLPDIYTVLSYLNHKMSCRQLSKLVHFFRVIALLN